ncbi:long-chain fatty acid--CoA ligase [Sporosarcina sp. ANT_H38]|uniref:acyl-CoA synthetase n=1 Tax=Sporosarcina sp. ANT_H38 TaxID=2597358 RepID=UPI0011F31115|nr:long-chain fatty acid--CoA ligase [Sporosarcina sp. ANT_H38]KAA0965204.1 long-chain fatty acid--CoA ligase [Sporosarcina sp. ANT_H38]
MINGIGSWLVKHSDRQANKTAIVYKDKRFTYRQLNDRVNRLAHSLVDLGVRKGDRVNALLFNRNELMEALFACAKIGAIFVPINFRLSLEEVEYIVHDSGGIIFIYDDRLEGIAEGLTARTPQIRSFIRVGDDQTGMHLAYELLLADAKREEPEYVVCLDDAHMMMYTSGTTGRPKGAVLTHGNTQWNAINCLDALPITEDMITLTVAPLFHIGGMNIFTTPALYKGGTVILEDKFDPQLTLELVEREKITALFLVPAMWLAITQFPNLENYDVSSLTFNISGGAPCPLTIIEFFQNRGIPFYEGFGLTETAPVVAVLDSENSVRRNGSVGKPPIHTEIKVVDAYGNEVPTGEVGELVVKGPNIFVEYWNKPEATKEAIRNGWFFTGDLAKQDEEGFLYIVDRMKDMIITGGENVYPIEVEQVLIRHPNIREVAVVGYPDEKWGESVKAVIALKNPNESLDLQEVRAFCEEKLASFKIPKQIDLVNELPRNATGKVLKIVLRAKETENSLI